MRRNAFLLNIAMMLCAIGVIGGAMGFILGIVLLIMGQTIAGAFAAVFGFLAAVLFQTVADEL